MKNVEYKLSFYTVKVIWTLITIYSIFLNYLEKLSKDRKQWTQLLTTWTVVSLVDLGASLGNLPTWKGDYVPYIMKRFVKNSDLVV